MSTPTEASSTSSTSTTLAANVSDSTFEFTTSSDSSTSISTKSSTSKITTSALTTELSPKTSSDSSTTTKTSTSLDITSPTLTTELLVTNTSGGVTSSILTTELSPNTSPDFSTSTATETSTSSAITSPTLTTELPVTSPTLTTELSPNTFSYSKTSQGTISGISLSVSPSATTSPTLTSDEYSSIASKQSSTTSADSKQAQTVSSLHVPNYQVSNVPSLQSSSHSNPPTRASTSVSTSTTSLQVYQGGNSPALFTHWSSGSAKQVPNGSTQSSGSSQTRPATTSPTTSASLGTSNSHNTLPLGAIKQMTLFGGSGPTRPLRTSSLMSAVIGKHTAGIKLSTKSAKPVLTTKSIPRSNLKRTTPSSRKTASPGAQSVHKATRPNLATIGPFKAVPGNRTQPTQPSIDINFASNALPLWLTIVLGIGAGILALLLLTCLLWCCLKMWGCYRGSLFGLGDDSRVFPDGHNDLKHRRNNRSGHSRPSSYHHKKENTVIYTVDEVKNVPGEQGAPPVRHKIPGNDDPLENKVDRRRNATGKSVRKELPKMWLPHSRPPQPYNYFRTTKIVDSF